MAASEKARSGLSNSSIVVLHCRQSKIRLS